MLKKLYLFLCGIILSSYVFSIASPVNVAPSNASENNSVGLSIDWSSVSENTGYLYQVDVVSTFDSPLLLNGTTGTNISEVYISSLYFGQTYYWRCAAKNSVDTSAWTSTWSFTTTDVIYNVAPSNGASATNVSIVLDWSSITGNSGYLYQIDTTSSFDSPLFLSGTTAPSVSEVTVSSLYFGQTYYWRCAAKNSVDTSAWTSTWSFTTTDVIYNVAPSNGATGQPISITLDWSSIAGNAGYLYQIDTTPNFNSTLFLSGATTPSVSEINISNLYFGQKYYWRCAAKNSVDTSAWTNTWSFTTLDAIYNTAPSNGATGQPVTITLDWSGIAGNAGYMYQLDTTAAFNSPWLINGNTSVSASEVNVGNLYFGQKYYWRCAAKTAVDTTAWTNTWSFSTSDILSNVSPSNGATGVAVNPFLDWSNFTGASAYLCRVDTTINFNSGELRNFSTATSQTNAAGLLYGTVYYWQAAARNAVDTSSWNNAWSFTTAYQMTTAPALIYPANLSANVPYINLGLQWGSISTANTYQYQVSTVSDFSSLVKYGTTSLINASVSGLIPYTTYYWRVRATNANGNSPWSIVWSYTTESANLVPPVLVSPLNNATGINSESVLLDWNSVFGASLYVFEISTDVNFISAVTTQQTANTYKEIIGLSINTQYFWRVKATDGSVESDWSEVWNFTTASLSIPTPVLISPADNQTNVPINNLMLHWTSVSIASQYIYEISIDELFTQNVASETVLINTVVFADAEYNTEYFWRVKASDGNNESDWSEVWSFTTSEQIVYYTLNISIGGYGYVSVDDVEYAEPIIVAAGTELSLFAYSIMPWPFQQWIGDLTGNNNPETIVMDSDKDITAEFIFVGLDQTLKIFNSTSIFPNPTNDNITILGDGISCVQIYSADGKLVLTDNNYMQQKLINISNLKPGIYFVKVNNQESGFIKMIKE